MSDLLNPILWIKSCLLTIVLILVSTTWLHWSANQALKTQLEKDLTPKIHSALLNVTDIGLSKNQLRHSINSDLNASTRLLNSWFYTQIKPQLISIEVSQHASSSVSFSGFSINGQSQNFPLVLMFNSQIQLNYLPIALINFIFSLIFFTTLNYLPKPLNASALSWHKKLKAHSDILKDPSLAQKVALMSKAQQTIIYQLMEQQLISADKLKTAITSQLNPLKTDLTNSQIECFIKIFPFLQDVPKALEFAVHPNTLTIDTKRQCICIKGHKIQLSKTPFIYYLWYAKQKLTDNEGWILNPSPNRPEKTAAQSLIKIMQNLNGHAKALNDLSEVGLKAKTLDQNRNKIKQEILSCLPEPIAEPYLFETRRDPRTQRYFYRLKADKNQIKIIGQ